MDVAVIMAGGKGQRFWPLSTSQRPKQFLDLNRCGRTLIQATRDRLLPLVGGPEHLLVATAADYLPLVHEQLPELPKENLLSEPVGRDSAPAVALASLELERRFGDCVAGFFSSDHRIGRPGAFQRAVRQAVELAQSENGLVTIGIRPTRPATGYGYIEQGRPVGPGFRVTRFVEKPNRQRAEQYLAAGSYAWNAGIFVWPTATILAELDRYVPELIRPLREAFAEGRIDKVFPTLKKISIDYAVMEQTERAYVIPGDFDWDDLGDWVALERLLESEGGNTVVGRHVGLETSANIIYTEDPDDVVVTLGVENLVVVKRGNTLLLVSRDRVQEIKKLLADERLAGLIE